VKRSHGTGKKEEARKKEGRKGKKGGNVLPTGSYP